MHYLYVRIFLGYSKSSLLDLAELIAETGAKMNSTYDHVHQEKLPMTTGEQALNSLDNSRSPEENISDARNTSSVETKITFNHGTAAGVLSNLKDGTKTMLLHEADVTLKTMGVLLPSPADVLPYRLDSFRSTLMTLHEKPGNFMRVLKKETINVAGSKLNIFVGFFGVSICYILTCFLGCFDG